MNKTSRIFIAFFSCAVATACVENADGIESGGAKQEWSILQIAELKFRGQIPQSPQIELIEGHELLSVPSMDGTQRIWIMLSPKYLPTYKQLPQGDFQIARSFVEGLQRSGKVSSTVASELFSRSANER